MNNITTSDVLQCAIPAVIGLNSDAISNAILKKNPFATKAREFFSKKLRLGSTASADLMIILLKLDKVLANKNAFYNQTLRRILETESGALAIDVLIKSGFDITKLSARNLDRLSSIVSKYGFSDELADLFTGSTDVNRMLIFLDNIVSRPLKTGSSLSLR